MEDNRAIMQKYVKYLGFGLGQGISVEPSTVDGRNVLSADFQGEVTLESLLVFAQHAPPGSTVKINGNIAVDLTEGQTEKKVVKQAHFPFHYYLAPLALCLVVALHWIMQEAPPPLF